MKDDRILLGAYWRNRRITVREYIATCYSFLMKLREFSDAFANRCVVIAGDPVILPSEYGPFEQIVARAINDPKCAYENPDADDKSLTLDSTSAVGFRVSFSDPDPKATLKTAISVSITAGAYGAYSPSNVALIKMPPEIANIWVADRRAIELMRIVVQSWRPTFAMLTSPELRAKLNRDVSNDFSIGPLTYFAERAIGNAVEGLVEVSDFSVDGALIAIDVPEPWAEHLQLLRPVYDKLSAADLLKWRVEQAA
jgi:hypothetical protein